MMSPGNLDRTGWLLGAAVLVVAGMLVHPSRAQEASRYALTAAIVEEGTVVIDSYEGTLSDDKAVREGRTYSDKAPGQPLLAVPFFAVGKILGIEDATIQRAEENLGIWWVTLWSSVIPGVVLIILIYMRIKETGMSRPGSAAFSIFFGTLLLPFSSLLFGHVLAAALLFGSYMLLVRDGPRPILALSGLLAGLGVTVEYTTVLGVFCLAVFALVRHQWKLGVFVAGGLVAAVGLATYNQIAFDNPLVVSYQYSAFREVTTTARPVVGMFSSATLENTWRLFFDGRGLFVATPVIPVALGGALSMLRRRFQIDAAISIAMFALFLLIPLFWSNPWGGSSPGPRYLIPALPFLGVPLARAFARWPRGTFVASGISILTMVVVTYTDPLIDRFSRHGLGTFIHRLFAGETASTVLTMLWGRGGWLVHLVLLSVPVALYFLFKRRSDANLDVGNSSTTLFAGELPRNGPN